MMKSRVSQLVIGAVASAAILAAGGGFHPAPNQPRAATQVSISSAQYECLKQLFEREVMANGN